MVSALLDDFQVPDLYTAYGEVGNLELNSDRSALLDFLLWKGVSDILRKAQTTLTAFDAGKAEVRAHQELLTPSKLLDLPHKSALVGSILHASSRSL